MIRPMCGTARGALAHQAAGEAWCGWCLAAERSARLAAERIAPLPPPEHACFSLVPLVPVTAGQAKANAALLDAEVAAAERSHGDRRHRPLRAVS